MGKIRHSGSIPEDLCSRYKSSALNIKLGPHVLAGIGVLTRYNRYYEKSIEFQLEMRLKVM